MFRIPVPALAARAHRCARRLRETRSWSGRGVRRGRPSLCSGYRTLVLVVKLEIARSSSKIGAKFAPRRRRMTDAPMTEPAYPVRFSVDYPDRELDRLSTAFRIFTVITIAIVLALVSAGGGGTPGGWDGEGRGVVLAFGSGGGILVLAPLLMILFRQKYPRWWFDWNLNLVRFENRVASYLFLLRDEYPS